MNRRSFLALLTAPLVAPFVVRKVSSDWIDIPVPYKVGTWTSIGPRPLVGTGTNWEYPTEWYLRNQLSLETWNDFYE